jgi:hypothetical protein
MGNAIKGMMYISGIILLIIMITPCIAPLVFTLFYFLGIFVVATFPYGLIPVGIVGLIILCMICKGISNFISSFKPEDENKYGGMSL